MRPVQGERQAQGLQELLLVQQISQLLLSGRHGEANGGWTKLKAANPPKAAEILRFTGGVFSIPEFYPYSSVVLAI